MSGYVTTGREPSLSGAHAPPSLSGQEPMLGGARRLDLFREYLIHQTRKLTITHLRRATIGDMLLEMGDTRSGVGLREDGLPDVAWCPVPAGEVVLRDSPEPHWMERFYIARYPVTWKQYRVFLEAPDGRNDWRWWEGLWRRPEYKREVTPIDNCPAQEVSWYDAVAYCRWLSDRLGYEVRLPFEWEWQQAATGGNSDYLYPWGRDWSANHANTRESGLRRAVAVGMYPHNESPVGAMDMSGNVLEWCQNEFRLRRGSDIPRGPGEPARRVLRGGSWFLVLSFARAHFRTGDNPYYRFNSVGFRLAASAPPPQ